MNEGGYVRLASAVEGRGIRRPDPKRARTGRLGRSQGQPSQAAMPPRRRCSSAILLVGCPCSLVISTPAAIAAGLSVGARRGLLIRGGVVLENLGRITLAAMDKTGTLTEGRPKVTDIVALGRTERECCRSKPPWQPAPRTRSRRRSLTRPSRQARPCRRPATLPLWEARA